MGARFIYSRRSSMQGKVWTEEELKSVNSSLENKTPQDIIRWVVENFRREEFALACSFAELTLLDILIKIKPDARVFYIDTGFLFKETLECVEKAEGKYGIMVERITPSLSREEIEKKYGAELWKKDPDRCCALLKVEPMTRVLKGLKCWLTGLRRCESPSRANAPIVGWDKKFGLVKVNPLANWSDKEVWDYITKNEVPYNALLDKGYPSIGCEPCTRPVAEGEYRRAGRWAGFNKTECGLHK